MSNDFSFLIAFYLKLNIVMLQKYIGNDFCNIHIAIIYYACLIQTPFYRGIRIKTGYS